MSADGNRLVYRSYDADSEAYETPVEVQVLDLATGRETRASLALEGKPSNDQAFETAVSADGSVVAFSSSASNLVRHDRNRSQDVFVTRIP
jgi:Tol biopolymer transport system component